MNGIDRQFIDNRAYFWKYIHYQVGYQKELAEDLLQELYIKVKNQVKKGNYREEGKFRGWVVWVAKNMIADYRRKENRSGIFLISDEKYSFIFTESKEITEAIEQKIIQIEETEWLFLAVERALAELDPEIRRVFVKRIYENKSFKSIVEEDGHSQNTEIGRMRYAKRTLKKKLLSFKKVA